MLTMKQHISMLAAYRGTSLAEIARRLDITRQTLYKKLDHNTLTSEDMARIAQAVGAKYRSAFVFPDGREASSDIKKLKRGTLSPEDMAQIAEAVGAKYRATFLFPDGKEISSDMY